MDNVPTKADTSTVASELAGGMGREIWTPKIGLCEKNISTGWLPRALLSLAGKLPKTDEGAHLVISVGVSARIPVPSHARHTPHSALLATWVARVRSRSGRFHVLNNMCV